MWRLPILSGRSKAPIRRFPMSGLSVIRKSHLVEKQILAPGLTGVTYAN